jgi:hypothetical protein
MVNNYMNDILKTLEHVHRLVRMVKALHQFSKGFALLPKYTFNEEKYFKYNDIMLLADELLAATKTEECAFTSGDLNPTK